MKLHVYMFKRVLVQSGDNALAALPGEDRKLLRCRAETGSRSISPPEHFLRLELVIIRAMSLIGQSQTRNRRYISFDINFFLDYDSRNTSECRCFDNGVCFTPALDRLRTIDILYSLCGNIEQHHPSGNIMLYVKYIILFR